MQIKQLLVKEAISYLFKKIQILGGKSHSKKSIAQGSSRPLTKTHLSASYVTLGEFSEP